MKQTSISLNNDANEMGNIECLSWWDSLQLGLNAVGNFCIKNRGICLEYGEKAINFMFGKDFNIAADFSK